MTNDEIKVLFDLLCKAHADKQLVIYDLVTKCLSETRLISLRDKMIGDGKYIQINWNQGE